jgi:membrane-bound lytic murein transglycosylase B
MKNVQMLCLTMFIVMAGVISPALASASFENWVRQFRQEALQKGISPAVFDKAFTGVTPNPRVIELDRKQPEKKIGFAEYRQKVISQKRIDTGREKLADHSRVLAEISAKSGVPSSVILALWGIETSYGKNTGGFDLIEALATLAWEGRRGSYFKGELLKALEILQQGHIARSDFKGSWAGAMGQNQFMPSSWQRYAVDHNGDGRRDIWGTTVDVFASSANYLAQNGWQKGQAWGRQIDLPENFPKSLTGTKIKKSVTAWMRMGVKPKTKLGDGEENLSASIVIPDGGEGRAYLTYHNYDVILSWNRSTYFGLSVGILSDLIAKGPAMSSPAEGSPASYNP